MVSVAQNPNIELMTYSEVEEISGFVGNYKVKVRKKPRYIDVQKCTGCGDCGSTTLVKEKPPQEIDGALWADRIQIDEARCIQCGDCVRACREENGERQGLKNVVDQRFQTLLPEGGPKKPTLLQKVLKMAPEEQEAFWCGQFQKCIKCYGCIDMCPVNMKDPNGLDLSKWVAGGQAPPPYPLFHLIRAYQVWDTCVGCGECERTCPAQIPLKTIQDMIRHLPPEKVFEVIPGLGKEAQDEIRTFIKQRNGSSRRITYAV